MKNLIVGLFVLVSFSTAAQFNCRYKYRQCIKEARKETKGLKRSLCYRHTQRGYRSDSSCSFPRQDEFLRLKEECKDKRHSCLWAQDYFR